MREGAAQQIAREFRRDAENVSAQTMTSKFQPSNNST
jgi:hypothetical protein